MKTLAITLILLSIASQAPSQTTYCAACRINTRTGKYYCAQSCPNANNEGCGTCCRTHPEPGGNSCYVGGCCTILSQGAICTDPSGSTCENLACQGGTIAPSSLAFANTTETRKALSDANWIRDENFRITVGKHSRMFDAILLSMQHLASENVAFLKDGVEYHFYLTPRANFGIKVTFATYKGTWFIRTDQADPREGVDAPSALEISGRDWKLLCHDHDSPTKLRTVATGSF